MKGLILGLCVLMVSPHSSLASAAQAKPKEASPPAAGSTNEEQEGLNLSKDKWRWMSERNVDALGALFHEKAVFVHMGGTMSRPRSSTSSEAEGSSTSTRRSWTRRCS